MFQSHMKFCRMQWSSTGFHGSLSVYSRPLPSQKNSPFAAQLKIAFRRFLFLHKKYFTTRGLVAVRRPTSVFFTNTSIQTCKTANTNNDNFLYAYCYR